MKSSAFALIPASRFPLRIGVLGASRIVPLAMKAALSEPDFPAKVMGIAARELGRARSMAQELGIPCAFGSYDELISNSEIDAIYIALPVSEHASFAVRALRAGKHVLCEKPFAMSLVEAQDVLACARQSGRLIMEAHHWRYHSLLGKVEQLLVQLGSLSSFSILFNAGLNQEADIRKNPLLGAGVTMDFGCYALNWAIWAVFCAGSLPRQATSLDVKILGVQMMEEGSGIDVVLQTDLSVDGVKGHIQCDMRDGTPFRAFVEAESDWGRLHFENPLVVEGSWVEFEPNLQGCAQGLVRERVDAKYSTTTYREQLVAFCEALRSGQFPPTAGESILQTQNLLDRLYEVAGLSSRVELRAAAAKKLG